ncbi:MAG TPA: ATP-binding protein [Actinomycetota bacterium]
MDILTPYRLRTVRAGVRATWLALFAMALYPLLPGNTVTNLPLYVATSSVAAVGVLLISILPWPRLFDRGWGTRVMALWSTFDIVLVSVAIGASGGQRSTLFVLYALTTLFFALSYPLLSQIALLLFTIAAYLASILVVGGDVSIADAVVRTALLGVVAFLSSFLGRELAHEMDEHANARRAAERHAQTLATVARASRAIATLESGSVLDAVVRSATELGFPSAALCLLTEDGERYRILHSHGLPEEFVNAPHSASEGLVGRVFDQRTTVTAEDYQVLPDALPPLRSAGLRAALATPVWRSGQLVAALAVATGEKRAIDAEDVEALELLAGQAGRALENAHLFEEQREAVRRLEELDRLKRDFIDMASHELRTPLAVIGGIGLTLERRWESLDEATRRELLDRLNSNAQTLNGIVSSLLDFSKLETHDAATQSRPIDITTVVRASVGKLGTSLQGQQVRLELQPGLVVSADPVLLERVLDNLLDNAAQHTPAGTEITISGRRSDGVVEVAVSDDGPGIAPEDIPHLGERFYRGGDPNDRPTRGAGLGLAIVREILALHGSQLVVESRLGEGSRFSFTLPRHHAQAAG